MVLAAFIFVLFKRLYICTHTHPFNGPLSGNTQVSRYQKGKPIGILLKQETVRGSGISWASGFQTGVRGPKGVRDGFPRGPREDSEK